MLLPDGQVPGVNPDLDQFITPTTSTADLRARLQGFSHHATGDGGFQDRFVKFVAAVADRLPDKEEVDPTEVSGAWTELLVEVITGVKAKSAEPVDEELPRFAREEAGSLMKAFPQVVSAIASREFALKSIKYQSVTMAMGVNAARQESN